LPDSSFAFATVAGAIALSSFDMALPYPASRVALEYESGISAGVKITLDILNCAAVVQTTAKHIIPTVQRALSNGRTQTMADLIIMLAYLCDYG
jgi:hypothetical protein